MTPAEDPRTTAPPDIREVTDEQKTRGVEVTFHVAVAAEPLLQILWNIDNFQRLFPDIKDYGLEDRDPAEPPRWLDVRYRVDAVVTQVGYVIRRTLEPDGLSFTWREISGDLKRVRGGWYMAETDVPGLTRVTYRAFVDIGRFVPTRLVAKGARRKAGEMVDRVRREAVALARK